MRRPRNVARVGVPLVLGVLSLTHPVLGESSPAAAIRSVGAWWFVLHLLLITGNAALAWALWPRAAFTRLVLGGFVACNAAFVGVDGLAVGILAGTDPGAAEALWASPLVALLADLSGGLWTAALLSLAAHAWLPNWRPQIRVGLGVIWLTVVAGSVLPLATLVGRVLALLGGVVHVYAVGARGLAFALLLMAAVSRQHVGPEAAFGMLCLALAALAGTTERSDLVAASPP